MSVVLKIVEWLVFGVLLLVLFAAASPLLPTKNALSSYVVSSGSMEPTLPTGALVFTSYTEPEDLKKGDVITFTQPTDTSSVVVHRIVEINGGEARSFQTKGDNNNAVDNWTVLPTQVLGETRFSIPYVGYAVMWLKTPLGFALGMGIPALLLLTLQIKKVKQGIQDEVEKRTKAALSQSSLARDIKHNLLLFFLFSAVISVSTPKVYALFTAEATVTGITLVVGEKEPTPTVTPTPTEGGCNNVNLEISGNGSDSTNTINLNCSNTTVINQYNSSSINNNIDVNVNTGSNEVSSTSGSIITGSSSASISVETTTNINVVETTQ